MANGNSEKEKKKSNNKAMLEGFKFALNLQKIKRNTLSNSGRRESRSTSNNNNTMINKYVNSSGRIRKIPETTDFYNRYLRRFMYKPSIGFYIILGLDRKGNVIKRRVPGHFYYRLDQKLQRIVPFKRSLSRSVKPPPEKKTTNNNKNNLRKLLAKAIL